MAATRVTLAGKLIVPEARAIVHPPILQRLAQHLQRLRGELGQLVQEQHAPVRQADLPRARPGSTTHQPGMTGGVVRRPERPLAHQRRLRRQQSAHTVDAGHLQRLVDRHRRQDRRQGPRQQRLARARRPAHDQVVRTGRRHLQAPLDVLLALDVGEIGSRSVVGRLHQAIVVGHRGNRHLASQVIHQVGQCSHRIHRRSPAPAMPPAHRSPERRPGSAPSRPPARPC